MLKVQSIIKRHLKGYSLLLVGLLIGIASSSLVFASVPDTSGAVHACYKTGGLLPNGAVRFIDSATQNCNGTETSVKLDKATPGNFVNNLAGADFSGADLRYREFAGANLNGAIFGGGVQIPHASFKGADFTNASISGINFLESDLSNTKFPSASISFVDFGTSSFSGADFRGIQQLSDTLFGGSNLASANFRNVHIINTNMVGVNAANVDFTNVHFDNVNISTTDLSHANVTGATWTNTICPDNTNSDSHGNTCIGHLVP